MRKTLKRGEVASFFAKLAPCVIGIEACGSAHFWARKLSELGHTVKLMVPQFVKPYVKTNKNDARDAEAICEAVTRPNMRFVPIKNVEQLIKRVLGHADGSVTAVYNRYGYVKEMREVLERWTAELTGGEFDAAKMSCEPEMVRYVFVEPTQAA